jgi:beta-hydroxyacyl-ACP dehydratase FabZ
MTESAGVISAQEILSILPHRYPFLLVDRVIEHDPERIVALKNVSWNEPFFQGHFPDAPIMPGVLIIEALAQAGGILAARQIGLDPTTHVMLFVAIDNCKFRRPVTPGDQLMLHAQLLRKGKICKLKAEALVAGQVVCQAEFLATSAPRDKAP